MRVPSSSVRAVGLRRGQGAVKLGAMAPAELRRYSRAVPGRLILFLLALLAAALIALALVWPQGTGRTSPAPFGHAMAPVNGAVR